MKEKTAVQQNLLFDNRKLAALLVPLAIDQLLNSFMGTVDTLVVSNLGSAAISAVSLVDSINVLIVQAFFALASGGTVVCSHYLGCRKQEQAKEAAGQLVFITFLMSAVIAVLCLVFNHQLLSLIFGEVEAAVMTNAKQYFFLSAISYPFIALYDDGACILRAQENSSLPMKISVASNVVNLALNLLFVWGFHFGVAGSACATLLARVFAMAAVMIKLRNPGLEVPLRNYFSIRPDWGEIKRILNIGVPSGIENGMFQFGKLMLQSLVSTLGTASIAGFAVANNLVTLQYLAGNALGLGLITIVGQCVGAGEVKQAKTYTKKLLAVNYGILLAVCTAMALGRGAIVGFYHLSPEAAGMAEELILVHCFAMTVWPPAFALPNTLRAGMDARFTMMVSVFSMWVFRIGFAYLLVRGFGFGIMGGWCGMFIDWIFRMAVFLWRFRGFEKRAKRI